MKRTMKVGLAAALALCIAAVPLAGCSGQAASSQVSSGQPEASQSAASEAGADQSAESSAATDVDLASSTSKVDVTSLKTLGDWEALGPIEVSGWNDTRYVGVVNAEGQLIRAVAEFTPELNEKLSAVDYSQDDHDAKVAEILGPVAVLAAEDLTPGIPSRDTLDAFVGKTGKDIADAGWTFSMYAMYGGDETMATFEQGDYAINVTFDGAIKESQSDDEGAAIMDLPASAVEFAGVSDQVTNPELA